MGVLAKLYLGKVNDSVSLGVEFLTISAHGAFAWKGIEGDG